jgi:hypothetical protein
VPANCRARSISCQTGRPPRRRHRVPLVPHPGPTLGDRPQRSAARRWGRHRNPLQATRSRSSTSHGGSSRALSDHGPMPRTALRTARKRQTHISHVHSGRVAPGRTFALRRHGLNDQFLSIEEVFTKEQIRKAEKSPVKEPMRRSAQSMRLVETTGTQSTLSRRELVCKLMISRWWRRGELNPRPRMPVVKRTTCVSGSWFSTFASKPARAAKA